MTTTTNCFVCHRSFGPDLFPIAPMRIVQNTCYSCLASLDLPLPFDCSSLNQFHDQFNHFQNAIKKLGLFMTSKNDRKLPRIKQIYEITGIDDTVFGENDEIREEFCSCVVSNVHNVYSFHRTGKPTKNIKGNVISFRYNCDRTTRISNSRKEIRVLVDKTYTNTQGVRVSRDDDICLGTLAIHMNLVTKTVTIAHNHINHEYKCLPKSSKEQEDEDNYGEFAKDFKERTLLGYGSAGKMFSLQRFRNIARSELGSEWIRMLLMFSRLDANPIISLYKLVTQKYEMYFTTKVVVSEGYFGIALIHKDASKHLFRTPELMMDSTFNIDTLGTELYTVLAPVDQVGCTVSYFFLFQDEHCERPNRDSNYYVSEETKEAEKQTKQSQLKVAREYLSEIYQKSNANMSIDEEDLMQIPKTKVLEWFMRCLKEFNFKPIFCGTSDDASLIDAIKNVFGCSVKLCMMHAIASVERFTQRNNTNTISESDLETYLSCAPDNELINDTGGLCSWSREAIQNGITNCDEHGDCKGDCLGSHMFTGEKRLSIPEPDADMAVRTLYLHASLIPHLPIQNDFTLVSENPTRDDLIKESTKQMFNFCMQKKLPLFWVYLWNNWYRPGQREKWMLLDVGPNGEIPLFCTKMDFDASYYNLEVILEGTSDLRLDEVVYTICKFLMPKELVQLYALMHVDRSIERRFAISLWRNELVRRLETMAQRSVDLYSRSADKDSTLLKQDVKTFKTDPVNFHCGCLQYHWVRGRICHHILAFYDPDLFIPDAANANPRKQRLIQEIQPASAAPFWRHELLVVSRHLDLIPPANEHIPRGQEDSRYYQPWDGDFYELVRRMGDTTTDSLSEIENVARDILKFDVHQMMLPRFCREYSQYFDEFEDFGEDFNPFVLLKEKLQNPLTDHYTKFLKDASKSLMSLIQAKENNDFSNFANLLNDARPLMEKTSRFKEAQKQRMCLSGEIYNIAPEGSPYQRPTTDNIDDACSKGGIDKKRLMDMIRDALNS